RALISVSAAIEDADFEDVALTEKIGRRLISLGDILGGVIYDRDGVRLGHFGKSPSLSWISARKEGVTRLRHPNMCCLDVLLPPEKTGLEHDLILRLDAVKAHGQVRNRFAALAITSLMDCLVFAFCVVLLLYFFVSQPIARMTRAAENAVRDPQNAQKYDLNWTRHDELGTLSQAITSLAKKTASVYRNELYVAKQVMYRTRLAIIHFNPEGHVIAVNRPGLRLFQAKTLRALRQSNPKMIRFETKLEGDPVDAIESLSEGSYSEAGFAVTKNGDIPCMISGSIMRKADGEPLRYAVTFVPTLDYANQINTLKAEIAEREAESEAKKRHSAEMRLISETYSNILETRNKTQLDLSNIEVVAIKSAVNHWHDYVTDVGVMADINWEDEKPTIKADREAVNDTFKKIMSCIFLRSQFERPLFSIKIETVDGEALDITVTETSLQDCRSYLPEDEERSHWKHLLPLISTALKGHGGELLNANARQGSPNEIAFRLPKDVSQMAEITEQPSTSAAA
ncbi:MAG: hypothetical protein ACR2OX_09365, partial [Methyloligellaceae bacterium]